MNKVLTENNVDLMLLCPSTGYVSTSASEAPSDIAVDHAEAWQAIEDKLIDWGCNPDQFDDDYPAPSRDVLRQACRFRSDFQVLVAPSSVRPDANGGIVFEWRHGNEKIVARLSGDTQVELLYFEDGKIVDRWALRESGQ